MLPAFSPGIVAGLTFFAGLAFGFGYFAVLRRTIDLYVAGQGRLVPLILTLGRAATAILFLAVAASNGPLPLLMSFVGFLLARAVMLWAVRGAT
jgi:hypothetical protein